MSVYILTLLLNMSYGDVYFGIFYVSLVISVISSSTPFESQEKISNKDIIKIKKKFIKTGANSIFQYTLKLQKLVISFY